MTFFEHKTRLFSSVNDRPSSVYTSQRKTESTLKSYSATDIRSWSLEENERRQFMLNLMNPPESDTTEWKYVSVSAVLSQLFIFHERQVCNLEMMIKELMEVLKNTLPQLGDAAMKETEQMLDDFSSKYGDYLHYFKEPLDIEALLCESKSKRSVSSMEYSERSGSSMSQTMEEATKTSSSSNRECEGCNKISKASITSSDFDMDICERSTIALLEDSPQHADIYGCGTIALIDHSPEHAILKQTEEKLKELQEESNADKDKIIELEDSLCAANRKVKTLMQEKNTLKLKLVELESCNSSCSSEDEVLKKIYITENGRMREELEALEQMCWRVKQVLQWVIKERDCYRKRCTKLEHLIYEVDDLKCELETWRFTEQERCRLEKVVHHLKQVLQEQDHQLKHLLVHIEMLTQRGKECRSKSFEDLSRASEESVCDFPQKHMLCLPSTSNGKLTSTKHKVVHLTLNTCSTESERHRLINSTIDKMFARLSKSQNSTSKSKPK